MGSQASWGSSFVSLKAFLRGLPRGVINRLAGRDLLGVLGAPAGWSAEVRQGDRDRDGERNWEGGADTIRGDGAGEGGGRAVFGAGVASA